MPLVMVYVAPELLQDPAGEGHRVPARATRGRDREVAAEAALDGAGTVNVIVWLAWLTDWPTEPLPPWLLSPE